jgi:hypothetical protein
LQSVALMLSETETWIWFRISFGTTVVLHRPCQSPYCCGLSYFVGKRYWIPFRGTRGGWIFLLRPAILHGRPCLHLLQRVQPSAAPRANERCDITKHYPPDNRVVAL